MRARAIAAAAALGLALAAGAAPALADEGPSFAGDSGNQCYDVGGMVDLVETEGAWWYDVCPTSGLIGEGETVNKYDAFDDMGDITAIGTSDVEILVPPGDAVWSYDGTTFTTSWTDDGVDLGGGTVVDVHVTLTIEGSYARWRVAATDSVTDLPVAVPYVFEGDLGSDGDSEYYVDGPNMLSYGDQNDPLILWNVDADIYAYVVSDGDDEAAVEAEGEEIVITLALLDYGCPSGPAADAAYTYGLTILATFASTFGSTLAVPGTEPCVLVQPMTVTSGQPFAIEPALTLDGFDFTEGGSVFDYYGLPDWAEFESVNNDVDGEAPIARLVGTAPAPGTYLIPVYVDDNADDYTTSRGFLELTVVAPQLANTGSETPWAFGLAALLALAAGAGLVVARRRTA